MLDLSGRIAVVTGASRGIGYFTALELARAGAHVIACARTVGGLEDLDDSIKALGGSATLVPFDLADMNAIDALGGAIFERWGKLDILVANAGVLGTISPIGHVEAKVFEKVMTVNVTATWRLIRSLDPLLQKSDQGRALILTSSLAHRCKPFWGPYSASKAAVEALARTWANEIERLPLKVISVDPGGTRTAMRAQAYPGEDPETLPHPHEVARVIAGLAGPDMNETGKLYLVREQRFAEYTQP
ncbi:SDR family NAD(P)-dependent oxidoreductase [Rhizobium sp. KVB221]|uniref:SDR family NAD(P)-dependent oxidoreductase n=1 Tax=Rhizobium setariae TaxID=2801340 RepID=A0A936YJ47_9HYPH|nr:SDR family NAD(P)-dependent oxidoreductase [Rhizobium setariae]MBL0371200.1 SDR family NAD(P)-dependent oxidoreductase [Rhizobium setariae]